jgi:hypothetical protein
MYLQDLFFNTILLGAQNTYFASQKWRVMHGGCWSKSTQDELNVTRKSKAISALS